MKTYDFVFPGTGVEIVIQKVNPNLYNDMIAVLNRTAPKPPTEKIETPGPMQGKESPILDDPDYLEKKAKHDAMVLEKTVTWYLKKAIVDVKVDDWEEQVKELRKEFKAIGGEDALEKDDLILYIYRIASANADDTSDLTNAIAHRSEPTEAEIERNLNTFQSDA